MPTVAGTEPAQGWEPETQLGSHIWTGRDQELELSPSPHPSMYALKES